MLFARISFLVSVFRGHTAALILFNFFILVMSSLSIYLTRCTVVLSTILSREKQSHFDQPYLFYFHTPTVHLFHFSSVNTLCTQNPLTVR